MQGSTTKAVAYNSKKRPGVSIIANLVRARFSSRCNVSSSAIISCISKMTGLTRVRSRVQFLQTSDSSLMLSMQNGHSIRVCVLAAGSRNHPPGISLAAEPATVDAESGLYLVQLGAQQIPLKRKLLVLGH